MKVCGKLSFILSVLVAILSLLGNVNSQNSDQIMMRVTNGVPDSPTVYFCFTSQQNFQQPNLIAGLSYATISNYFTLNNTMKWDVGVFLDSQCSASSFILSSSYTFSPSFDFLISFVGLLAEETSLVSYDTSVAPPPSSSESSINLYYQSLNASSITIALFASSKLGSALFDLSEDKENHCTGYSNAPVGNLTAIMELDYIHPVPNGPAGMAIIFPFTSVAGSYYSVFSWGILDDRGKTLRAVIANDQYFHNHNNYSTYRRLTSPIPQKNEKGIPFFGESESVLVISHFIPN